MNRLVFWITLVVAMFWAMTVQAQEPQDSTESVNKLVELQEVIVKGGLPNTRLKAGAMITRIEGTPLAQSGTLGEMLVKVPGMTGTDETPEVLGKGSPLIYINGRKMRDASELKRLHSEDRSSTTLGENVSDNGGLKIAYRAYKNRMASEPLGDVDGFTPDQRFYLAYARVRACNSTPEYTAMLVNSDVHSPARLRVMAALPMIDTWYEAFGILPTDKMFIPKEKRALVW